MSDRIEIVTVPASELEALVERAVRKVAPASAECEPSEVMTREQVGKFLQVDPHHVTKLARERGLPSHKLGSEWRFRRSEVLEWLSQQKGAA